MIALARHKPRPTKSPKPIPRYVRDTAKALAEELENTRLQWTWLPARRPRAGGDKKYYYRAVEENNPDWYRLFCGRYRSQRRDWYRWRRFKTSIKRRDTLRGLRELAAGRCGSEYAKRLIGVVKHEFDKEMQEIPF